MKAGHAAPGRGEPLPEAAKSARSYRCRSAESETDILPQAYELSTLTGTQVMLLVASETGHVYTFATRKLQPMITSESGKQLIQTCLNSPDENSVNPADQRMAATGYEETDLSYNILNQESSSEDIKVGLPSS